MSELSVVLATGGTAGHIEPALNLADALRRIDPSVRITVIGSNRGLETSLVPARGYELRTVAAVPLPRKPSIDLLLVTPRVSGAVSDVIPNAHPHARLSHSYCFLASEYL
jgi:UDP-N-acetylglucosamine--N-acetylmuramyl-(pentapeptide) pyrophosphoryl-undecaprenol N-acetylglucosamine transferase